MGINKYIGLFEYKEMDKMITYGKPASMLRTSRLRTKQSTKSICPIGLGPACSSYPSKLSGHGTKQSTGPDRPLDHINNLSKQSTGPW